MEKGKFIVFEGVDGAGKSTIIEQLKKYCCENIIDAVFTREPGGSSIGSQMRTLIDKESKNKNQNHDLKYLSIAVDRAYHCKEIIIPALQENKIVFCDRFFDSSLVYQGIYCDTEWMRDIFNRTCSIKLHMTFYVSVPFAVAITRINNRKKDPLDEYAEAHLSELMSRYDQLYKNHEAVMYLDGEKSPEENVKVVMQKMFFSL